MAVKITYFVHGTTYDNLEHRATGWLPGELSPKGIEQAKALKEKIDIEKFDIVFCSDLQRAIDSAGYIFFIIPVKGAFKESIPISLPAISSALSPL